MAKDKFIYYLKNNKFIEDVKGALPRPSFDFDAGEGGGESPIPRMRGDKIPIPLPESSQSLVVPATQSGLEVRNVEYREGDMEQRYEIGEQIAHTENGGQGSVFRAKRRTDGLDVILKFYAGKEKGSWEDIFAADKRAGREIRFLEKANREGIRGVPVLVEYGTTGYSIKTPVASFEPLSGRTLEDEVADPNYTSNWENVLSTMGSLVETVDYAHEKNGVNSVVHKDINPGNIIVNGEPILIDWATSANPSTGRTLLRTQMYTRYFSAPEVIGGKEFEEKGFDKRADIYSLGRVAQFMLLGADMFGAAEGEPTIDDFKRMNIPSKVAEVLDKATKRNPDQRYRTVREFYDALSGSVPARIEAQMPAPVPAEVQRQEVSGVERNKILEELRDLVSDKGPLAGMTICDKMKWIRDYNETLPNGITRDGILLAYVQNVADQNPNNHILQDFAARIAPLEGMLREKGPSLGKTILNEMRSMAMIYDDLKRGHLGNFPIEGSAFMLRKALQNYRTAKQAYNQRRKQLLDVFGMNGWDFEFPNKGAINGALGGGLASLITSIPLILPLSPLSGLTMIIPYVAGHIALGAIVGSNIQRYRAKRKLLKKTREVDSWIREARVSQGLENKVEGVELTPSEPEWEEQSFEVYEPHYDSLPNLMKIFSDAELKKKRWGKKFIGKGIEIKYWNDFGSEGDAYFGTVIKMRSIKGHPIANKVTQELKQMRKAISG